MARGVKNVAHSFNKHVSAVYKTILQVVFTIVSSSLAIAALCVGLERKSQCPIQTKIPTWLIVYGALGIVGSIFVITTAIIKCLCCSKEENEKMCDVCIYFINSIFGLLSLAWVIVGSVWVFKAKSSVQFTDPTALDTYCEKNMFNFAFGLLLSFYSLIGFLCCCGCCVCCLGILGLAFDDDDD